MSTKKSLTRKADSKSKSTVSKLRKKSDHEKRKSSRVHLGRMHIGADYSVEVEPNPEGPVSVYDFLKYASAGGIKTVTKFLDDGGDVNVVDVCHRSALHLAALYCKPAVVELLMQRGADPNLQDKLKNTPLHWACRGEMLDIVQLLLDGGAKVNLKDELLVTPLHVATRVGFGEGVKYLLDCGAKINAKDFEGDTPSHDAIRLGRQKLVKTLIVRGANLKIKNKSGKTAEELVQSWHNDTKEALKTGCRRKHSQNEEEEEDSD